MPVLVTAAQLRAVLGVPITLYDDNALNAIINTAEDAIGDFLVQHKVAIVEHSSKDNVWTNYTEVPHKFYVGQSLTITDSHHPGITGTKTVLEIPDEYSFTFTQVYPDFDRHWTIPSGTAAANTLAQYDGIAAVEEAVLQISVDVFQSRLAAGGTQQALDFTPAPYRMGRTLLYKVTGLISKYIDSNSQVG
jgi:hypothetical protein